MIRKRGLEASLQDYNDSTSRNRCNLSFINRSALLNALRSACNLFKVSRSTRLKGHMENNGDGDAGFKCLPLFISVNPAAEVFCLSPAPFRPYPLIFSPPFAFTILRATDQSDPNER